ncbi:MAG: outer membrane lipoprotein carrier protein LolA [Candidatus Brocadiae bacterium]|nr:outer membrane lipoprotein carrier protein LolA [Candidatus Brocadiia bacterium]
MKYLLSAILIFQYFLIADTEKFAAMNPVDAKIFMDQLRQEMQKVKTIAFDFYQEKHLVLFDDALHLKGWCYVEKPNKIRWEYISPIQKKILLCNDKIRVYKGLEEISLEENQGFLLVYKYILGFFEGTFSIDTSHFICTLKQAKEDQDIFLVEMKSQGKLTQFIDHIEMKISKKASRLIEFLLFEPNGDYTRIGVGSYILNPRLSPGLFDTKIIKEFQDGFFQR